MDIVAIRGEGDSPGEDIVEPLLSDVNAALSRGRVELDQGSLADEQQLEVTLRDVRLGQLVAVDDSALGYWKGKVTAVVHTVNVDDEGNLSARTNVTLRKPR
jgi:hypothetical protein